MDERFQNGWRFAGRNTPAGTTPDSISSLPPLMADGSYSRNSRQLSDQSLPLSPNGAQAGNSPAAGGPTPVIVGPNIDPDFSVGGEVVPGPDFDSDFSVDGETIPGPDFDLDFSVDGEVVPGPDFDPDFSVDPEVGPGPIITPDFNIGGGVIILPGLINPRYATVRFLNAATGYGPLRITVGNRLAASSLPFGGLSGYGRVGDGFYTVSISRARYPREVISQLSIPFTAGELVTLAVVRTSIGVDLVRVSDTPCRNRPFGRACIRCVNLCWNAPALDVLLNDGRLVFSDVRYKEVTNFRRARPQDYGFYIAQTSYVPTPYFSDIETLEDTPLIAPNYNLPGIGVLQPLSSFYINAKRNGVYTAYILGSWNYPRPSIRVRVVEDFQ